MDHHSSSIFCFCVGSTTAHPSTRGRGIARSARIASSPRPRWIITSSLAPPQRQARSIDFQTTKASARYAPINGGAMARICLCMGRASIEGVSIENRCGGASAFVPAELASHERANNKKCVETRACCASTLLGLVCIVGLLIGFEPRTTKQKSMSPLRPLTLQTPTTETNTSPQHNAHREEQPPPPQAS